MHRVFSIATLLVLIFSSLIVPLFGGGSNYFSSADNPAYARVGAYALYSGNGGFVAFLSGVSANISYYVHAI